jgi:hypothetical protein
MSGKPFGCLIKLGISDGAAVFDNRNLVAMAFNGSGESRYEARISQSFVGIVPGLDVSSLGGRTQRNRIKLGIRIAVQDRQKRQKLISNPANRFIGVEIAVEFPLDLKALFALNNVEQDVEFGTGILDRQRRDFSLAETCFCLGRVLQNKHHIENRILTQAPLGFQIFDQKIEGQGLMLESRLHGLGRAGDEIAQARIGSHGVAQNQAVDEETQHRQKLRPGAVGHRRADQHIALTGIAADKQAECGIEHDKKRRVMRAGKSLQRCEISARNLPADIGRAAALGLPARVIGRDVVARRHVFQHLAPIRKEALAQGASHIRHQGLRVIGILPGRWQSVASVELGQILNQNSCRPAIESDMMQAQNKDMLLLRKPDQPRPDHRPIRQVHWLGDFCCCNRMPGHLPFWSGQFAQVGQHHRQAHGIKDNLMRNAIPGTIDRTQDFMAGDKIIKRSTEPVDIQFTLDPVIKRQVVAGASPIKLIEKPQLALWKGKRKNLTGFARQSLDQV